MTVDHETIEVNSLVDVTEKRPFSLKDKHLKSMPIKRTNGPLQCEHALPFFVLSEIKGQL